MILYYFLDNFKINLTNKGDQCIMGDPNTLLIYSLCGFLAPIQVGC